jgi:Trk K+ transport system NAD-binding subunit
MEQPFILCGLGRIGWRVLEHLRAAGLPVVVVDTRCSPNDPRLGSIRLVKGDCRQQEVLDEAGVLNARGILILTNDDLVNISTALLVRHLNRHVRVVMRLFNQNLVARLGKAVSNVHALSTAHFTAPLFALTALTGQALGMIRFGNTDDDLREVIETAVTTDSPLRGRTIAAVAADYLAHVIAHLPFGAVPRYLLGVEPTAQLIPGDRLILCGRPPDLAPLLGDGPAALADVRWAGWLRRMGRVVWRALREVEIPVKISGAILVAVISLSTLVFYFNLELRNPEHERYRLFYAIFRTISIMATGGDMHDEQLKNWVLTYAAGLRISGAALIATFTAIFTNYLLRARLGGALEVRRVPDSGHVIVCGLGNIGYRVVEVLVKYQERVVAIEQARDSRFVATARRLGVPVLIGDATVLEVLRQAHAASAKAVIASTSDDLINLEVALLARELNPAQRVVVHLSDPRLAETVREAANIRLALSIPSLVAPAFVAALFGDRVHTIFVSHEKMFATVDLLISPDDSRFVGRSVPDVTAEYGIMPVAILDAKGEPLSCRYNGQLEPGYRLVGISALGDLERLLRRGLTAAQASESS